MAKTKKAKKQEEPKVLVGYVNEFEFIDKKSLELFNGHPAVGRIYQLIYDDTYGYRLHIGSDKTKQGLQGILLGPELASNYDNRWKFDISLVTKENFINFDIISDDIKYLSEWFGDPSELLKDVINQEVRIVANNDNGQLITLDDNGDPVLAVYNEEDEFEFLNDANMIKFSESLNLIISKDQDLFNCLTGFIEYLGTTYSDKYELPNRTNYGKRFLIESNSPDATLFNSFKYLQRYCTTGFDKSRNIKDVYKAIHYCLFELQRNKQNEKN